MLSAYYFVGSDNYVVILVTFLKTNLTTGSTVIEFPPVYRKRLLNVPTKLGLLTEENLVQPNCVLTLILLMSRIG
jgi:hypothetical protein